MTSLPTAKDQAGSKLDQPNQTTSIHNFVYRKSLKKSGSMVEVDGQPDIQQLSFNFDAFRIIMSIE